MTITQAAKAKAVELANREAAQEGYCDLDDFESDPVLTALARVLQKHSDAFKVMRDYFGNECSTISFVQLSDGRRVQFANFILPDDPDPLEEAMRKSLPRSQADAAFAVLRDFRAAADAAGYQITRKDGV